MLDVFISVFVFLRHHSFDASPLVLLMSILWVVAGMILLLSPQIGSPYFIGYYIYELIMSVLLIKDVYFFPGKATLLFLLIPLLDFLPLLIIILIRFFTPRPPNTFIYVLCYLTQIFMFLWLEGCGPYSFYRLSGVLALLLKQIAENVVTVGFFPAIFSRTSLVLIYYTIITVFHYQINLSFMYAQNTAAIKQTKLFFAPSFTPLRRFRLLYLTSLIIQQFFENVVFSIYFIYCTLVFINAYLIASRGSLSHVHNGPWMTLFLSTFLLLYSCYNALITFIPLASGKTSRSDILLIVCLLFSSIISVGINVMLLGIGKRIRINIINDYKYVKVSRSFDLCGRRRYFKVRLLSITPAKNLKIRALTSGDQCPTSKNSKITNRCIPNREERSARKVYTAQKDTALLLDPTTVSSYTLHTPLSRYMVMILAFYFDIHTVISFILPNDYTFTTDDINNLVFFMRDNRSTKHLPEKHTIERPPLSSDPFTSMPQLHSTMNNPMLSSPLGKSAMDSYANRRRSVSATHRHATLMQSTFTIPNKISITNKEILKPGLLTGCNTDSQNFYQLIDTDSTTHPAKAPCIVTDIPLQYCHSSDDNLIYRSDISSEDLSNLPAASNLPSVRCLVPGRLKSEVSVTPKTGCEIPNKLPLTPNQRLLRDFLNSLDSQKIFKYVAQAEALLENFRLFYENIYASLFLSYCAASQTLESITLLDIEECLPIPLLLRYLRAWKTPGDAYNSIIYYIDQLKSVDDLRLEYQETRAARKELEKTSDTSNTARGILPKTIFVESRKLPSFTCKQSCANCRRCRVCVTCNHCYTKIVVLLKPTFNIITEGTGADQTPLKGFTCPNCNRPCLLKIVDSVSKKQAKAKLGAQMHKISVQPRILQNYIAFLNKLTPLGKRIQVSAIYSRKKLPVVNFSSFKTVPAQADIETSHSKQRSKRWARRTVQLLLRSYINNTEGNLNEKLPVTCEWATQTYAFTTNSHQSNIEAKQLPNSKTDSNRFSRDRNIGLLHKSYSVISPQNFNGSIYFLSPELFVDVAISEESKSFLYNCRKQNYLVTIFLPTITSTSSTTGNIHRLNFAYDRAASLTSPLRILRMKVLIHLARMLFPAHLYVDKIYPIQLVPCYKFYTLGSSYIENATSRVRMVYSPEFLLKRQEDSEVRIISRRTNIKKILQAVYRHEPLYLYCLAQNALTVKTQDKMDSSILQFVNVEYLFMQAAFTGICNSNLSFFYRLYYTNNVSFFTHLLSLSRRSDSANSSVDLATKLNKQGPNLSTVSGSIVINALSIALNCHTLSDQTADAYAMIDRLLGGMYSAHLPIYTWLEMIKIRLSTCSVYLDFLRSLNSDIFSKFETAPTATSNRSITMEISSLSSIPSGLNFDTDDRKKREELERGSKPERMDKSRLRHGHSLNVYTIGDYYHLNDIISDLLSTCQALLDKQVNELALITESHEVHMTKLSDDCAHFFKRYYAASTHYLLHITFDLPGVVKYTPRAIRTRPIYRYRNGDPQLIAHPKDHSKHSDSSHNPDIKASNIREIGSESDTNGLESLALNMRHDIDDSESNLQDNSAAFLPHSPAPIMDNFSKLFVPQLPHMATSQHPKTMVISKKQISANLFAIYEHVILENDALETILLNNITTNGLPSIDINGTSFSLLSLLGKSPFHHTDQLLPRDLDDTLNSSAAATSIDITQLQDLLNVYVQEIAKEKYIDEIIQHFSSQSLYEKADSRNYSRVSTSRLRQIILSLNTTTYHTSVLGDNTISSSDALSPLRTPVGEEQCDNTALPIPGVSATFSATFSTTISATYSHMTERQIIFPEPLISNRHIASSQLTTLNTEQRLETANKERHKFSKFLPWSSTKSRRKFINKRRKSSSGSLLEPEEIKLFLKSGSEYTPLSVPFSRSSLPLPLVIDSVSMHQLLLSLIVMLNLVHLYSSSNVLTTYEYRGRQLLTLQQNRFIVDLNGGYYPASYRQELEQSYTLNFNTQNPDDAVKKFIYCFDESSVGMFPVKRPALCRRYLNTDFDLTIPIDGMKYIHASDSPNNLLAITSRTQWLENLKQPDFNTPINVYECVELQVSMKIGLLFSRYEVGFANLLLYNSIIFDTLIQLRNIIRVDSTLRAKIHAYKMLPRLGMFSNYADHLLKRFFESIIHIQNSIIESDQSTLHTSNSESPTKISSIEAGNNTLMPMLIQHSKDLHKCLDILHTYEHTLQNLWIMRLTLLRHSYAEEDFLLLLQNECLRTLSTTYGLPSEYFFILFSSIMGLNPEVKQCYMSPSIERAFPRHFELLYQLRSNDYDTRTHTPLCSRLSDNAYLRQQSVIRYFTLMESDAKRIEMVNRSFFITIAELFALGRDPLAILEHAFATSPRTGGIYALGPQLDVSYFSEGIDELHTPSSHVTSLTAEEYLSNDKKHDNLDNAMPLDSSLVNILPTSSLVSSETNTSITQDRQALLTAAHTTDVITPTTGIYSSNQSQTAPRKLNSTGIFSHTYSRHRRMLTFLHTHYPIALLILFYITLVGYLLSIYSYFLTSHVIVKNFLRQSGHISGMMAAFSDLRTEIDMNVALQQTKNNPFEILSGYVERFNEIANNAYYAHVITTAMYNGLSVDDVLQKELDLSNYWPPPMLYYSGEQIMNPEDLKIISDYQTITCNITIGTLSNQSIETLMYAKENRPTKLNYLNMKLLPLKNLRYLFSDFRVRAQGDDLTQLQHSDIKNYLDSYNKFTIGLYDSGFRRFINTHPVTIPIASSYPLGYQKNQTNPESADYFETTEALLNRIVCMAASMIYISQQKATFGPTSVLSKESSKISLYRPMASLMLEADFLQTVYQNMYINLQTIVINTWEIYSRYTINILVLIAFTLLAVGLFIPLYYLNFQRIQRRVLKAKLDRACILANILSLPPSVLHSIITNYNQAAMIPFKQFWWGNRGSSNTNINMPREYYSDIYSYTQSKSVYNQTCFKLAELTTHSSKAISDNARINQHNDPDHSSRFYSYTDEISLILRLVAIYNDISNSKMYILLYIFACMIFVFFFIVNVIFPLHFKSPFISSGLDINNYHGIWGNSTQFSFQLSVNGWDPEIIEPVQLAQEQLYNISKITKHWAAPQSSPSSIAVDGRDLVGYMTGARAIEYGTNKLYSPFYINKYMDNLVQTPFLYAFDYIRDHTKLMVSLLQWLDEVNFIGSVSNGPSRCLQCAKMYYLLQYVLRTSPVSLIYYVELLSHFSGVNTENFLQSSYYLDFFTVHKRFLDVFSNIHDNLWKGFASDADVSAIVAFSQRYKYFSNYNSTGDATYDESVAIALVNSIKPNTALPSMVQKHESLVRSLLNRFYGGSIIFNAIVLLLFLVSLVIYLTVSCIFVYKSVVLAIKVYNKISTVTQCACSIKYLMSCFMPLDLVFLVPILLVAVLITSLPVIYYTGSTMMSIFLNYVAYPLSAEAILREDNTFSHNLVPLSYKKFLNVQFITNYLSLLIFLLSSLSHHVTLRSRTVIDTVGYIKYTKEREQELFNAEKNPFVFSVSEKITICRAANRSILDHDSDDENNDKDKDRDENNGNCNDINAYFDLYDDYIPENNVTNTSNRSIEKTSTCKLADDPFLQEQKTVSVTYSLPVFLPPLFIPRQRLEYVEVLLRYSLICLFVVSVHLLISISHLADYTPKTISVAFLDQLIHNYNILRAQLSQIYAYPAVSYKEPHLFINTFKYFRQMIAFLLANKYTQGILSIPIQNMRVFKNHGIDNAFYEYGQHIKNFLESSVYGYTNKVTKFSGSAIEYDSVVLTAWMSGSKYYNTWSNIPPTNRSKLFVSTKIPDYHKDRFADNSILLPLYQKLLLFEYAYYQPNFANIQSSLEGMLTRSATGAYGSNFASLPSEYKKIILFDILRNQIRMESLYCNHYLMMASMLLHSISISQALTELSIILLIILIVAITHVIAHKLLLLLYNKKLTLYEVFTVLFLKRIRGLVN